MDVHDSVTVLKIIEQASNDHITKIADVHKSINEGTYHKGKATDYGDACEADLSNSKTQEEALRKHVFPQEHAKKIPF